MNWITKLFRSKEATDELRREAQVDAVAVNAQATRSASQKALCELERVPQRPAKQLRLRFDPRDPATEPIVAFMEQVPLGGMRSGIAQALRVGAAAEMGVEPLKQPAATGKSVPRSRRFVPMEMGALTHAKRMEVFTVYDRRDPCNAHLEAILGRCEWGQTNATMIRLLITGLRSMGYSQRGAGPAQPQPGGTAAATAPKTDSPASSPIEPGSTFASAVPPAPTRRSASSVVGFDPTQAMPYASGAGVNSLIRGIGRRSDQV